MATVAKDTKVSVGARMLRGARVWVVDWKQDGKRKRTFWKTESAAQAEAVRIRGGAVDIALEWQRLPVDEQRYLLGAYREAKRKGVDLFSAINSREAATGGGPPLSEVVTELLTAKRNAGRAKPYTDNLSLILGEFSKGLNVPVGAVSLADVERYLATKKLASRATLRARLSTLFRFAIRRGYCQANPCAGLESVTVPHIPPAVFTPEQVRTCLEWLAEHPRASAWFVLSTFCGLRPEEAEQSRRADIHFAEGWVRVEAQTSKVGQRRVVYPRPEAMALLQRSLKAGGELPLDWQARRRALRAMRGLLGWPAWPKDVTRHSAASYWLAGGESAAKVAEALGHSERVLNRNYRAIVTQEQAKAFWAVASEMAAARFLKDGPPAKRIKDRDERETNENHQNKSGLSL